MTKSHGVGMIGCDHIAIARHLPTLIAKPSVRLSAVRGTDENRAIAAARFSLPVAMADHRQILVDLAMVGTTMEIVTP